MARLPEKGPENDLPEHPFEVMPGAEVVRVLREDIPILEHTNGLRGRPCTGRFGMEAELPQQQGTTVVCLKCHVDGMIEAVGE